MGPTAEIADSVTAALAAGGAPTDLSDGDTIKYSTVGSDGFAPLRQVYR
jgi:hypothetical protein